MADRTGLVVIDGLQAVRLSEGTAFDAGVRDVTIIRDGPRRIVVPVEASWDDFFDSEGVDLGARTQPEASCNV